MEHSYLGQEEGYESTISHTQKTEQITIKQYLKILEQFKHKHKT